MQYLAEPSKVVYGAKDGTEEKVFDVPCIKYGAGFGVAGRLSEASQYPVYPGTKIGPHLLCSTGIPRRILVSRYE